MLPVFELFGSEFGDAELYVLLVLVFAIVFTVVIFLAFKAKSTPSIKNREELYLEFSKLGEDKAQMKAKLAALEETKNYGRISQPDYEEQLFKTEKQIGSINADMDDLLKKLASPHYDIKLQQEKSMETEKMSLMVRLQQEVNAYKGKMDEFNGTIEDLRRRNEILGGENEEFKQKLDNLEDTYKSRVMKLEEQLDAAKKSGAVRENPPAQEGAGEEEPRKYKEKMEEYYHKILLYQLLISRYKDHIETSEKKTVSDVKSLVQPTNSNITPIVQRIKSENKESLKQYQAAYAFVGEIHSIPFIGATFWLSVKEMLDNKVADYEDKAILLCSILRGLGANAKTLVCMMADGSNRPIVMITLKDKSILLDPNLQHDFADYVGKKSDLIKQFSAKDQQIKRVLYEFNDKEYVSYEG